jgi:hypothetical protein
MVQIQCRDEETRKVPCGDKTKCEWSFITLFTTLYIKSIKYLWKIFRSDSRLYNAFLTRTGDQRFFIG